MFQRSNPNELMTPAEAFTTGIAMACAEKRASSQEFVKTAGILLALASVGAAVPAWLLWRGSKKFGTSHGEALANMFHEDPFDVKDVKTEELVQLYDELTSDQKIKALQARKARQKKPTSFSAI